MKNEILSHFQQNFYTNLSNDFLWPFYKQQTSLHTINTLIAIIGFKQYSLFNFSEDIN